MLLRALFCCDVEWLLAEPDNVKFDPIIEATLGRVRSRSAER